MRYPNNEVRCRWKDVRWHMPVVILVRQMGAELRVGDVMLLTVDFGGGGVVVVVVVLRQFLDMRAVLGDDDSRQA